jgi:RimJ/RimL family protein N-acetyltransferase
MWRGIGVFTSASLAIVSSLESDRILLRAIGDEDLVQLVKWYQDPSVATFLSSGPLIPRPESALVEQYRNMTGRRDTDVYLAVVSKADEKLVGTVALEGADAHNRTATFVLMIGPPYQGQGYGLAATRLTLEYGFNELGLHRVQLVVFGYNERAMKTYKNAGFIEEGRARQSLFRGGVWHDKVHMGILAGEWRDLVNGSPGGTRP